MVSNYLPLVYWDLLLAGIPNLWCVSALLDLLPSSLRSLVYTCQYSSVKKGSKCASAIITYFPSAVFCRQNANYLSTTILCQLEVSSWLSRFTTTRVTITTWKIEGDISPHRNYTNFRKTIRDIPPVVFNRVIIPFRIYVYDATPEYCMSYYCQTNLRSLRVLYSFFSSGY